MAKSNLRARYVDSLTTNEFGRSDILSSVAGQRQQDRLHNTLTILKEAGASCDVDLIVDIEKISLKIRLNRLEQTSPPDRDQQEKSSLKAGIQRTEEATRALQGVRRGSEYEARLLTTAKKDLDRDGLPKDSFRTFVTGQIASLNNQLRTPADRIEKDILEQRIENLRTAETLYKGLQKQALGQDLQQSSRTEPIRMGDKLLETLTASMSTANRDKMVQILADEASRKNMTIPQYLEQRAGLEPKARKVEKAPTPDKGRSR